MKPEIVAIVPAKGSSERVPKKNIRPFYNTNLLELKLNQLKQVPSLDRIVVSSEDQEILEIAKRAGVDVHVRDPKYSTGHVPFSQVMSAIASDVTGDVVVWAAVTSPLAGTEVYENAIKTYLTMDKKHDCLISVFELKEYVFLHGKPVNFPRAPWPRSQDLQGLCAITFAVNILSRENLIRWGSVVGETPYFFYLDPVTALDIDFMPQFQFAEMIYKQLVEKK